MRMPFPQSAHATVIAMICTFGSPGYAEQSLAQAKTSAAWLWHSEVTRKEPGSRYSVERPSPMIMQALELPAITPESRTQRELASDKRGRRSDTAHFLAYQVSAIAILYSMPERVTGWTSEQKDSYSLDRWWENVRHPKCDNDDHFINYVLHPYWGGAYFVRSRERGYGELASFWYAAALSASYEFGAEALFEEPSIQDLIATPVGGWFLGRYFMGVRERILAGHDGLTELPFGNRLILTITDPLGALNRAVDGWFGFGQQFSIQPLVYTVTTPHAAHTNGIAAGDDERVFMLTFTYRW